MKLAMIRLNEAFQQAGVATRMLLQVHDELVLECPTGEVDDTVQLVRETMENAYELDVPLNTDARQGKDWGSMQPIEP